MKTLIAVAALLLAASAGTASAAGCASDALLGAGAGHLAGHHAVLGGIAEYAVGHHHAKVEERRRQEEMQQQASRNDENGDTYRR